MPRFMFLTSSEPLGATLALGMLFVLLGSSATWAQDRRRALQTPGLILETGAPTAATTSIQFTRDGTHVLAAGYDKAIRQWAMDEAGKLDRDQGQIFRWAIYREQRGSIYTMALSPDEQQQYLAIGGFGLRNGSLSLIRRATGEVVAGVTEPNHGKVVNRLVFSPSGQSVAYGTSDGALRLWKPHEGRNNLREIGGHGAAAGWIRAMAYLAEDRLISLAEDGSLRQWNPQRPDGGPQPLEPLRLRLVRDAEISRDGSRLAATGPRRVDGRWCFELRSLDDGQSKTVVFREGYFPYRIAFNSAGDKLAIGVHRDPESGRFHHPVQPFVYLYDLATDKFEVDGTPRPTAVVDALAFSPDGSKLVVAGGDDHELQVWDFDTGQAADVVRGPGSSIWQVALSPDSQRLGLRHQRRDDPPGFNAWGGGAWRVFDLERRTWVNEVEQQRFQPVLPQSQSKSRQWQVQPDVNDMFVWHVRHVPSGQRFPLPLNRDRDLQPRCFTFLDARGNGPERLVVGHQWGMSIFSLRRGQPPTLDRMCVGHQGEVTSVAASADQTILVSASRDQTIAAWTLADWPNQRELGASFVARGNALAVRDVAAGSPGWEAGLTPGDVLRRLAYGGKLVEGGAAPWERVLRSPTPGLELYFEVQRQGEAEPVKMLTTVRQRPLWRFFPTRGQEWVLWRWRDFFYDCSMQGDDLIGWQVNGDVDETPTFTRAEQNRERFHKPDKIEAILTQTRVDPEQVAVPELVQPRVELSLSRNQAGELTATVAATARDELFITEPMEVTLWINDHKFRQWIRPAVPFQQSLPIAAADLRSGRNRLVAQAYSKYGVRGDSKEMLVDAPEAVRKPRLLGLSVGINDYRYAAPISSRGDRWSSLNFATQDAEAVHQALMFQQATKHYEEVRLELLVDNQATRQAVVDRLRRAAEAARPDDLFVLFMAGHGWAKEVGRSARDPASFAFVTPRFDVNRSLETGLRFSLERGASDTGDETLFELLAKIRCRKLLLLDCCHSGGSTHMIRNLTPNRLVGPMVMVACDKDELSWELIFKGHGVFTSTLLESWGDGFSEADINGDGVLDAQEMARRVRSRVPDLIEVGRPLLEALGLKPGQSQRPQIFLPDDDALVQLFARRDATTSADSGN